jgi:hypothetical protein
MHGRIQPAPSIAARNGRGRLRKKIKRLLERGGKLAVLPTGGAPNLALEAAVSKAARARTPVNAAAAQA